MKAPRKFVLMLSLLSSFFWVTTQAIASPQLSSLQEERDTKIRARAVDYQARLDALYEERLQAWSVSFLAHRREAIQRAGESLAAKATEIRANRRADWSEVADDPEFQALERQQIAQLLDPQEIRRELTAWAREVENQTRKEMIEFFRQLIAEDLGKVFDQRLRGQVVQAVQAIPLETLVTADAHRIEARIRSALPTSSLTRQQRNTISAAASALAFVAGPALATAAGVPGFAKQVAALSALTARWLASQGLDMLDQALSGKPSPAALSHQIELALREWQDHQLADRLEKILDQFGTQVMDVLEDQARKINLQSGGR